eukprot:scaffold93476_cov47-Attheya_sp.AAC.1
MVDNTKTQLIRAKKTISRIWYATSKLIPRTRALLGGIALLGGLLPPRAGPTTICTLLLGISLTSCTVLPFVAWALTKRLFFLFAVFRSTQCDYKTDLDSKPDCPTF